MSLSKILSALWRKIVHRKYYLQDVAEIINPEEQQPSACEMFLNELLFAPDQKIVYWKNGEYYSEVDHKKSMSLDAAKYFRYYQPFVKVGEYLELVLVEDMVRTTDVIVRAFRSGNNIYYQAKNGCRYRVEYVGIDLEKVLEEGKNTSKDIVRQFPKAA